MLGTGSGDSGASVGLSSVEASDATGDGGGLGTSSGGVEGVGTRSGDAGASAAASAGAGLGIGSGVVGASAPAATGARLGNIASKADKAARDSSGVPKASRASSTVPNRKFTASVSAHTLYIWTGFLGVVPFHSAKPHRVSQTNLRKRKQGVQLQWWHNVGSAPKPKQL